MRGRTTAPFAILLEGKLKSMEKLNFYIADFSYVDYLKEAELAKRGFSRVPDVNYGQHRKPKFLCGVVLQVNSVNYYVPVTSYKKQKPDNFLIIANNGQAVSSLRFNYMFPIPPDALTVRNIKNEPDQAYRSLLAQELRYCINNQDTIQRLAERTYKRVLLGKNIGLVANSCDFLLLEEKCREWQQTRQVKQVNGTIPAKKHRKKTR